MPPEQEPCFTPDELYNLALEFAAHPRERQHMYERNLSPCLHAMPILLSFA
jgi:hypothetical protein